MIYGVCFQIQQAEIEAYCFTSCGHIVIGAIDAGDCGDFLPCQQDECPHEAARSPRAFPLESGEEMTIRKLKPIE